MLIVDFIYARFVSIVPSTRGSDVNEHEHAVFTQIYIYKYICKKPGEMCAAHAHNSPKTDCKLLYANQECCGDGARSGSLDVVSSSFWFYEMK